ncbi:unnamed protein product, partial [marine sediment metagenome]
NGVGFEVPNGRYLEVRATLLGDGRVSPVLHALRVEGRNLAPRIERAAPTVLRIDRIDHTLELIGITGADDPEDDPFEITITGVKQDEPVSGLSEDDRSPDAIGIGEETVWLRAECDDGTEENPGNGRVYVIAFKAADCWGATSVGKVKVTVPRMISAREVALDDKDRYDSAKDNAVAGIQTSENETLRCAQGDTLLALSF